MKLQQFSGGLNSRLAPHLLQINEGHTCTNVDIEDKTLSPVKTPLAAGVGTYTENDRYIEYENSIVTLAKTPTSFVEYQNKVYYSVADDFIQVKDSSTEGDLGLEPPTILDTALSATRPTTPVLGDITVNQSEDTATFPTGWKSGETYEFAIVRVDSNGNESIPFLHSVLASTYGSGYAHFQFDLPYSFRIFRKIGNRWGKYATSALTNDSFEVSYITVPATPTYVYSSVLIGFVGWYYDFDVDSMLLATNFTGNTTYVVTAYSTTLGWESEPSTAHEIIPDSGGADVATITVGMTNTDSRIDKLKIYRIGGAVTDFTLVDIIDYASGVIEVSDSKSNLEIAGNAILDSVYNVKPPSGLKNLAVAEGQLIGTVETRLYYSKKGAVHAIPLTQYRDFKEELTGTLLIDAGLLVFSATKTWLINTSNLATGKILPLSAEFGCIAHNTAQQYKTGGIWTSRDGFCTSSGGKVELITKHKLGYTNLSSVDAQMHNETYFAFDTNGICTALDMRYTPAVTEFNFATFDDSDSNTIVHQAYVQNSQLKLLWGQTGSIDSYALFQGSTDETFTWQSAKFIEGAYTEIKTYKQIYIRATANITFKVYLDDILVKEETFYATDTHEVKIPQKEEKAYSIYFDITGTGTVYEIEYKTMGRKNGR